MVTRTRGKHYLLTLYRMDGSGITVSFVEYRKDHKIYGSIEGTPNSSFTMAIKDLNGIIRLRELFPEWVALQEAKPPAIVRGRSIPEM